MAHSDFTSALLEWFGENGRDLPWRETKDPYAIWLSEVILRKQTRIQQGRAYWERFMQRFPTVQSLRTQAKTKCCAFGRDWAITAAHEICITSAARQIAALGSFPNTFETIRKLKGVGDYTAAAIGSSAFDLPVAAVDGNVYRVLSRHYGIETPINSTEGKGVYVIGAIAFAHRPTCGFQTKG